MFEAEIERGAELLDKDDPGWALESAKRSIDLRALNMGSTKRCILGQRGGDYADELIRLSEWKNNPYPDWLGLHELSASCGFSLDSKLGYRTLEKEWRAFIRKRRKDATLALSETKGRKKP